MKLSEIKEKLQADGDKVGIREIATAADNARPVGLTETDVPYETIRDRLGLRHTSELMNPPDPGNSDVDKIQVFELAELLQADDVVLLARLQDAGLVPQDADMTFFVSEAEARQTWHDFQWPSAANLVAEYQANGLPDFDLAHLKEVGPWLPRSSSGKSVKADHVIQSEEAENLRELLNWLVAVQTTLNGHLADKDLWVTPTGQEIVDMYNSESEQIVYTGICGHEVVQSNKVYRERYRAYKEDGKSSPLLRLCSSCRAEVVALLQAGPGTANYLSVCAYCNEPKFTGDDPAASFQRSRGDIWENLISGLYDVYRLIWKLSPNHNLNDPRHAEHMVRAGAEFDEWLQVYEADMAAQVSKDSSVGQDLIDKKKDDIKRKRVEVGLEEW